MNMKNELALSLLTKLHFLFHFLTFYHYVSYFLPSSKQNQGMIYLFRHLMIIVVLDVNFTNCRRIETNFAT